jgi:hypothetical protein
LAAEALATVVVAEALATVVVVDAAPRHVMTGAVGKIQCNNSYCYT